MIDIIVNRRERQKGVEMRRGGGKAAERKGSRIQNTLHERPETRNGNREGTFKNFRYDRRARRRRHDKRGLQRHRRR